MKANLFEKKTVLLLINMVNQCHLQTEKNIVNHLESSKDPRYIIFFPTKHPTFWIILLMQP